MSLYDRVVYAAGLGEGERRSKRAADYANNDAVMRHLGFDLQPIRALIVPSKAKKNKSKKHK